MVDLDLPSTTPTKREPRYINDYENWDVVHCERFLDAAETNVIGRLIWVPDWQIIPSSFKRNWGDYCLLRQLTAVPPSEPEWVRSRLSTS